VNSQRWPADPGLDDALLVIVWMLLIWAIVAGLDMVGGSW